MVTATPKHNHLTVDIIFRSCPPACHKAPTASLQNFVPAIRFQETQPLLLIAQPVFHVKQKIITETLQISSLQVGLSIQIHRGDKGLGERSNFEVKGER